MPYYANTAPTKLSIIIPAYNEEKTIQQLLSLLFSVDFGEIETEVIVIDDSSRDKTVQLINELHFPLTLIENKKNLGKSGAVRKGLAVATGEYVVIQDADLEYNPHDLKKMITHAFEKKLVAVYGSRRMQELADQALGRKTIFYYRGLSLTLFTNVLFRSTLTDEPTCYKLIRRSILQDLNLKEERFGFCPEVTAKLLRQGYTIAELPISYQPRSIAEGKKISFVDALEAFYILIKYKVLPRKFW